MKIEKLDPGADMERAALPANRQKGFWALNWLRFILAIYIVLFHTLRMNYPAIGNTWFDSALGLGNMATSVFFALSGFLLMHAYVVMKNGRAINRRNFLIARFSTLYPLHIVALVIAAGTVAVTLFAQGGVTVVTDEAGTVRTLARWEVLLSLFMSITLLNAWNPLYMVFNGPSWSLSALAFYYLIFPVIALKIFRMKSPRTAIVLLGIAFLLPGAIADLLGRTDVLTTGLLHRNPIIRLPLFIAGMVLCVMFSRSETAGTRAQWFWSGALIVGTIVFATVLLHSDHQSHLIQNGLYLPSSLAILWLCACAKPTSHDRVRYWGDRLGAAALPVFLLHMPMFALFRKAEQVLQVWPSASSGVKALLSAARQAEQSLLFYPVYLILLVAVCVFVQERFVTRLQKAIRNRYSDNGEAARAATNTQRATGTF